MPDTQGQPQSPGLLDGTVSSEAVLHESESSPTGIDAQSNDSTQRMIATLRDCFEALQNSNVEQFSSLKTALERLTWVEAQKQPTQSIDTKTSFWTAYKKLADEFDKELKDKYGDDLDNSLIFAGLFSAVTSAFIIQIQPEFQPGPNATTEALLVFLVQNITASAVPANLVVAHNVSTIVVVAQCLLYFSLFCTLFAALLAVLGKQWVMYYHSVDGKGTIAERGLARQRKLDSLERWNFTLIMEISPLLLQFSLLLFATGLSIYLWTINHTIAKILVALASLGFILYILIIVLSLVRRDSPFQTSLTTFLLHILPRSSRFSGTSQNILASFPCSKSLMKLCTRIYGLWKNWTTSMEAIPSILPYFIIGKATEPASTNAAHIFPHIPPPSPETSAIVWVLETSTDLKLVEVAAAVVPDLQWPTSRNLDHCLKRLADAFNGCFDDHYLREGMDSFATSCIHAFGVLHLVNNSHVQPSNVWTLEPDLCYSHGQGSEELTTITIWFQTRNLEIDLHTVITPWAVQFMSDGTLSEEHLPELLGNFNPDEASLRDPSVLADFLFCVNSIFVRPSVQDISLRDKRDYCVELTTAVFENIVKHLTGPEPLKLAQAEKILNILLQFKHSLSQYSPGADPQCRTVMYSFCAMPFVEHSTRMSTLFLARTSHGMDPGTDHQPMNIGWVYAALQELRAPFRDIDAIGDLIQVIVHFGRPAEQPVPDALRTILWAITSDHPGGRTRRLGCLALCSADGWFRDMQLEPLLKEKSIWKILREAGFGIPPIRTHYYLSLTDKISSSPGWKVFISQDPLSFLQTLPLAIHDSPLARRLFCSLVSHVWEIDIAESKHFEELEKPLVMAFLMLVMSWDGFSISDSPAAEDDFIRLIQGTAGTCWCARMTGAFRVHSLELFTPSQIFRDTMMVPLGDALARAADKLRAVNWPGVFGRGAEIMTKLAGTIKGELRDRPIPCDERIAEELRYWLTLQGRFDADIASLRDWGSVENPSLLPNVIQEE